ncbi:hypothetical protein UlMin_045087 [Ulmus minor]
MFSQRSEQSLHIETTCGFLLQELENMWDEVGEPNAERNEMLEEIEHECLKVYQQKVDEAKKLRARMKQEIAKSEAEIAVISSVMDEQPPCFDWKTVGSLKSELELIMPQLVDMRSRKIERKNQFLEVLDQLEKISNELGVSLEDSLYKMVADETDLSLNRLEELRARLLVNLDEKEKRLKQVSDHLRTLNSLCLVLGMDFKHTVCEINPRMDDREGVKDLSTNTIKSLADAISGLREVKMQRWEKLKKFATSLLEMWNLMDIPMEEQKRFYNITSIIAASASEVTETNMLSIEFLDSVEAEVSRLEQLKSSKLKELVQIKRLELEKISITAHMIPEYPSETVESGTVDHECLLEQVEVQIARAKEEVLSRKEILEKVEKWMVACQEECWLDDYNKDVNRYNAGRGAHLTLKRAEKARALVNKIPAMVEALTSKTKALEEERGFEFLYDSERLLSMLEQYKISRHEKEQERQWLREQKKLQGQLIAEQETLYGSKASPSKSGRKAVQNLTGVVAKDRRLSLGGALLQNKRPEKPALRMPPQKNSTGHYHNGGSAAPSFGKRNSEAFVGSLVKQTKGVAKAHETEQSPIRKPLSGVTSRVSSKANMANVLEDQNRKKNSTATTPLKPIMVGEDENITPKAMQVLNTPSTASIPLLTVKTPPTPSFSSEQPVEYSFEEVRAGFFLPKTNGISTCNFN